MRFNEAFTADLLKPEFRGQPHRMAGHCYVAAEVVHWMRPDYAPHFIRHEGQPHWFLRNPTTGLVIDPTASQFSTPVPYDKAKGKGFLTKQPSKRALTVIERLSL